MLTAKALASPDQSLLKVQYTHLGGCYHNGTIELEPLENTLSNTLTLRPLAGPACSANQEVPALLLLNLSDHHFTVQLSLSLSRGQLHSIRQEAGCRIKDMGVY